MRIEKRMSGLPGPILLACIDARFSRALDALLQFRRSERASRPLWPFETLCRVDPIPRPVRKGVRCRRPLKAGQSGRPVSAGILDQRPMVDLVSPDGSINLRLSDISIPSHTLPMQFHERQKEVDRRCSLAISGNDIDAAPEFCNLYSEIVCELPATRRIRRTRFSAPDHLRMEQRRQNTGGRIAFRLRCPDQGLLRRLPTLTPRRRSPERYGRFRPSSAFSLLPSPFRGETD